MRVDGSSVSRLSLNDVDSSVALIESSPADTRDASTETIVPINFAVVSISSLTRLSIELARHIQEQTRGVVSDGDY